MSPTQYAFAIVVLFAAFKNGDALRCWACSSELDPCGDYFNTTRWSYSYNRDVSRVSTPRLDECNQHQSQFYPLNQKPVCMKKKMYTGSDDRITYIRACQFVPLETQPGECKAETTSSRFKVDFCEYCEYDGCNGATSIQNKAMVVLALPIFVYFMRK